MPHILVRDFSNKQKRAVEAAADACKPPKSTSRFCRDAAVLAAGGTLEDNGAGAKKAATKKKGKL